MKSNDFPKFIILSICFKKCCDRNLHNEQDNSPLNSKMYAEPVPKEIVALFHAVALPGSI